MPKCPPIEVNVDAIVKAAKDQVLKECPAMGRDVSDSVEHVNVLGLPSPRLMEPIKPTMFLTGYVLVPAAVNFVTKLAQVGVIFPQVDLAVSRGVLAGVTLAATYLSGGKSFLVGAALGQIPSTLDALADVAVAAVIRAKAGGGAPLPAAPAVKGLGDEADQLRRLQQDLERLQGSEMDGVESLAGELVVR